MYSNTISQRYKAAFAVMKQCFVKIWGLSLLSMFIIALVNGLGWAVPIITVPFSLALYAGMCGIYLKAVRGEEFKSADLFDAFKDFATAKRVICGLLWMTLWLIIWALIPIAGFVFVIIKALEYGFTPYILMTNPDLGPMEALNESKKMTKGLKGRMFGAVIIPMAIYLGAIIVLSIFSLIPFIGLLFVLLILLVEIAFAVFVPLLYGLLFAGFYDGVVNPAPIPPQQQYQPYQQYGQPNPQYQQPQYYQPAPQQGQYYQPAPQPYPEKQMQPTVAPVAPVPPTAPAAPAEDFAPTEAVTSTPVPEPGPAVSDFEPTFMVNPIPASALAAPESDMTVQIDRPVVLPEFPETEAPQ